ncbi:hypothetical protein ACU686_25275 [Yinghuangia aomiensis]
MRPSRGERRLLAEMGGAYSRLDDHLPDHRGLLPLAAHRFAREERLRTRPTAIQGARSSKARPAPATVVAAEARPRCRPRSRHRLSTPTSRSADPDRRRSATLDAA